VRLSNLQVLNTLLFLAEQGCKWRGLPERYANWHTIYVRMNHWAKSGALNRVFVKVQLEQIVRIKIEAFRLDLTSVKMHPDGTGALKKRTTGYWKVSRRMEHQDSSGCRGYSNGHSIFVVSGQRSGYSGRTRYARRVGSNAQGPCHADGSCL
jgi:transposase